MEKISYLSEIDYLQLAQETSYTNRGVYNREVYFDEKNNCFIKLWKEDFFYKDNFSRAYNFGFYNDIALIQTVITDFSQRFRGYATKKGNPVNWANLNKHLLNDLVNRVAAACLLHQMVYIDFRIDNIVEVDGKYYLIDLEAVIAKDDLAAFPGLKTALEHCNYQYRKLIHSLIADFEGTDVKVIRQHTCNEKEIKYGTANGRIFLEKEYLPQLDGSVLFVGVNYYNDFYSQLIKQPERFETVEIDEEHIEYGSPHVHYVADIRNLTHEHTGKQYDHVCFFGILGHADDWDIVRDAYEVIKVMKSLNNLVKPGGTLLLGPATQTVKADHWLNLYKNVLPELAHYEPVYEKQIDINVIWWGRKK